jgi:hypothetical protein
VVALNGDSKSCAANQLSRDRRGDGLFTLTLLEALRGSADRDGDGVVTLHEVERYLRDRLRPGMPGPEQDCLCESSGGVPANLPLTAAIAA